MNKKIIMVICTLFILVVLGILLFFNYYLPLDIYNMAKSNESEFDIYCAIDQYGDILEFKDSRKNIESLSKYIFDENYHVQFNLTARINDYGQLKIKYMPKEKSRSIEQVEMIENVKDVAYLPFCDMSGNFKDAFFALLGNGSLIRVQEELDSKEEYAEREFIVKDLERDFFDAEWANISKISNSCSHIVGLRYDGTVVAAGNNSTGQCDTELWSDIIDVVAGEGFTVGLKSDGKVVIAMYDDRSYIRKTTDENTIVREEYEKTKNFEDIHTWDNIIKISADLNHIVGLTENGKVVAVGQNRYGQLNVDNWENIVDVRTTEMTTFAIDNNGNVHFTERLK